MLSYKCFVKNYSLVIICLISFSKDVISQSPNKQQDERSFLTDVEIKATVGGLWFYGDISSHYFFPRINDFGTSLRGGFDLGIKKAITKRFSGEISFQKGSLSDVKNISSTGLKEIHFLNNYYTIKATINYDVTKLIFNKKPLKRFHFLINAGIGLNRFRSYSWIVNPNVLYDFYGYNNNRNDKANRENAMVIPTGFSFQYRYNCRTSLYLEYQLTNTFTDKLDAFTRKWTSKDKYSYLGVGISFNIKPSKSFCDLDKYIDENDFVVIKGKVENLIDSIQKINVVLTDTAGIFVSETITSREDGSYVFLAPLDSTYLIHYEYKGVELGGTDTINLLENNKNDNAKQKSILKILKIKPAIINKNDLTRWQIIGKLIPKNTKVQYLDKQGKILYEEEIAEDQTFEFNKLPDGEDYRIKLIAENELLPCEELKIVLKQPKQGDKHYLTASDTACIFKEKPYWELKNLPKNKSYLVEYLDEDGKIVFQDSTDNQGRVKYKHLADNKFYALRIVTPDTNFPFKKIQVLLRLKHLPHDTSTIELMYEDDGIYKYQLDAIKKWKILGGSLPKNVKAQYLNTKGKILYEEEIVEDQTFGFHKLPRGEDYIIQLLSEDETIPCEELKIVLKQGEQHYLTASDTACIFKEKPYWELKNLPKNKSYLVEYLDEDGKIVFQDSTDNQGRVKYKHLADNKFYALRIVTPDTNFPFKKIQVLLRLKHLPHDTSTIELMYEDDGIYKYQFETPTKEKLLLQYYFNYNEHLVPTTNKQYLILLDYIIKSIKKNQQVRISIETSSSKVPTRTFVSNHHLSMQRLSSMQQEIINSLISRNMDISKVDFNVKSILVQGKEDNNKKNKKFQFVKVYFVGN